MIIGALIISKYPASRRQYIAYSCNVLSYILRNDAGLLAERYPQCSSAVNWSVQHIAIQANFGGGEDERRVEELSAALQACFPMAAWLAWLLHVVGTEVYLKLTPAEAERLRAISYQRQVSCAWMLLMQLELGYRNPGNGGLTVERLGDASPYVPPPTSPISGAPTA
jgi:hypothetical protein